MKHFLNFSLWIPIVTTAKPLLVTTFRMQIFFFIRKRVYNFVSDRVKKALVMRHNPEQKEPMDGPYIVKHFNVLNDAGNRVKATQYRGSALLYKRHPMMLQGSGD